MKDAKTEKNLKLSIVEGSFNSAASSITDSYITPFLLSLGADNVQIGLANSLKSFANIFSQIPGAKLTNYLSRKSVWIISSLISRLLWIPIIIIPFFYPNPIIAIIALFTLASFFLTLRSPAWSSLMGDIVPMKIRGAYFGKRNMIMGFCGLFATLISGIILSVYGFTTIFIMSVVFGMISILFFIFMYEPYFKKTYVYKHEISFHPKNIINAIKINKNFSLFTAYVMFTNFAVEISAPFIAVYMLKDLNVSYEWFAILIFVGALVKTIFNKYWGKLADRYGNRRIMFVCGILISFVPFGYMLSSNIAHLLIVKIFDGFAWAGFDIVVFNFLLDITPSKKRPGYVANYTFVTGIGSVIGAIFGAYLAQTYSNSFFIGLYGLQIVFFISFILRMASISILSNVKEVGTKETDVVPVRYIIWEAAAVEPGRDIRYAIRYAFRHAYKINALRKKVDLKLKDMRFKKEDFTEISKQEIEKAEIRVIVENLECFSDIDRIIKDAELGYIIFVYTVGMREKSVDELEHAIIKIKEGCSKFKSQVFFADDDWLLIIPENMKIEKE